MKQRYILLGKIAHVISGYAFKSQDFQESGVPVIKISNIKQESITFENCQYLNEEFLSIDKKYHVSNGDILISLTGSHLSQPNSVVGRIARYRHPFDSLLNQRVGKIIVKDTSKYVDTYIYYFLLQDDVRYTLAVNAKGSANQANISPSDVEGLLIPDFPYSLQKRIADILSSYDDLIENNKRRIALLEESARLLYKEWFVHFRFPGHEHVKIIDGVPEGWRRSTLDQIAEIVMGQSPESKYYNETGDGLPFHQGVSDFGVRFPSNSIYCTIKNRTAEPGDILFSVRAPVGRINIAPELLVIGRGLSAIREKSGYQSFLFYQLKNHFFKEDIIGGGTIFASITKKALQEVNLLTPPVQLIEAFQRYVLPIDKQIEILHKSTDSLRKARDILLPRLMKGEIQL
ncbi:restriction endonuclease subunit S [Brevibacillus composti]|uniref:Restriction endonuclease subunit S n=1 Tax=Brevibacillus composti TaxID=2796470 RepID=A0A7T5EK05_9BACL|nr:restriction endonuclease subunit S [Brevibacillus composti]QQE74006.1 restriction endonuclease subunit S [Brevibacillus composti]QUO41090.1 restriction endonuclease subunit S [Brevibacillus composti]